MYNRKQLFLGSGQESLFLWGARQTGKSTLLKTLFPDGLWFDLLISGEYKRLSAKPDILRETVLANLNTKPVIIDEIQRVPDLLLAHGITIGNRFCAWRPRSGYRSKSHRTGFR